MGVSVIVAVSVLIGESPAVLLGGLGVMATLLMLVFQDAILGFVAGIQLSANKMVAPGDWIEMPKYGADGDVLEVALTTVKVQNFDKTITTVPTYALISESFKNWRGMAESGRTADQAGDQYRYELDSVLRRRHARAAVADSLHGRVSRGEAAGRSRPGTPNTRGSRRPRCTPGG